MIRSLAAVLIVATIAGGCAAPMRTYWYKSGVTEAERQRDHDECVYDVAKAGANADPYYQTTINKMADRDSRQQELLALCLKARSYTAHTQARPG